MFIKSCLRSKAPLVLRSSSLLISLPLLSSAPLTIEEVEAKGSDDNRKMPATATPAPEEEQEGRPSPEQLSLYATEVDLFSSQPLLTQSQ
jgi:hypothetical protein